MKHCTSSPEFHASLTISNADMESMRDSRIGSTLVAFNRKPSCMLTEFLNYAVFANG
jgi:hypothetical protein